MSLCGCPLFLDQRADRQGTISITVFVALFKLMENLFLTHPDFLKGSLPNFAHDKTVIAVWHLQKFVAVAILWSGLKLQKEIAIEFETCPKLTCASGEGHYILAREDNCPSVALYYSWMREQTGRTDIADDQGWKLLNQCPPLVNHLLFFFKIIPFLFTHQIFIFGRYRIAAA